MDLVAGDGKNADVDFCFFIFEEFFDDAVNLLRALEKSVFRTRVRIGVVFTFSERSDEIQDITDINIIRVYINSALNVANDIKTAEGPAVAVVIVGE